MLNFEIHPHEGVNDVRFGMSQDEVEAKEPGGSFKAVRNPDPDFLTYIVTDDSSEQAFYYFNKNGLLSHIEFSNRCNVHLNKKKLGGLTASELRGSLLVEDESVEDDDEGFKSSKLGISVWVENSVENKVGSILVEP